MTSVDVSNKKIQFYKTDSKETFHLVFYVKFLFNPKKTFFTNDKF